MRWNHLVMVIVLAAICFGGSFTCHGHSGDHDSTVVVK
jgi:hypothetical protein